MPDYRRVNCAKPPRGCGKSSENVGAISWSGLCAECGERRLYENITDLHLMRGEALQRWRRGMAATVGAVLLDDLPPQT